MSTWPLTASNGPLPSALGRKTAEASCCPSLWWMPTWFWGNGVITSFTFLVSQMTSTKGLQIVSICEYCHTWYWFSDKTKALWTNRIQPDAHWCRWCGKQDSQSSLPGTAQPSPGQSSSTVSSTAVLCSTKRQHFALPWAWAVFWNFMRIKGTPMSPQSHFLLRDVLTEVKYFVLASLFSWTDRFSWNLSTMIFNIVILIFFLFLSLSTSRKKRNNTTHFS